MVKTCRPFGRDQRGSDLRWSWFFLGICTNFASGLSLEWQGFFEVGLCGDLERRVADEIMSELFVVRCTWGGTYGTCGTYETYGICEIFWGPMVCIAFYHIAAVDNQAHLGFGNRPAGSNWPARCE